MKYAVIALTDPKDHARIYHAFLYLFNLIDNGIQAELFLDGKAVEIVNEMEKNPNDIIKPLYDRALKEGLISQACNFCAGAFNVKEKLTQSQVSLSEEGSHIDVGRLAKDGYELLTV